ncbi:uncharacterized protein LOC131614112 [Vicia villosa]|uniref:uncharacterized protein LOC131614112 n=1 Tax=Vicia villosa TaxID=3911 RepID=UPI00273B5FEE|nr:uncharacterized protein LOC131614112 [Vicia villosa]
MQPKNFDGSVESKFQNFIAKLGVVVEDQRREDKGKLEGLKILAEESNEGGGGGSMIERRRLCQLIRKEKADIMLFQETKLKEVSTSTVRSLWGNEDHDFSFMGAEGLLGGMLTVWNSKTVTTLFSFCGKGFLGNKVYWKGGNYYIVNVYSPCSLCDKRDVWTQLLHLKQNYIDVEWIIDGDFNAVKTRSERVGRGVGRSNVEWREFLKFIEESGLVDVPCKGKKFSWFCGDGKSKSRLDRFLVEDSLVSSLGIVGQLIGRWDISDHCPRGLEVFGRGDFVLKEKLRLIKDKLRWWNLNVFGKFELAVEEGVNILNAADDSERWEEEEIEIKKKASKNIWLNLKIKENMLIQKG